MPESSLSDLLDTLPQNGRVEWIGLSPGRREPIHAVAEVEARIGTGLVGDRHSQSGRGKRQVTLIQWEHLATVGGLLGRKEPVRPEELRRNIVIRGINLLAFKDREFRVGEVMLLGTGPCAPCSRMEENLGPGGYNAMRGHGGITASVVVPGMTRIGDRVSFSSQSI